MDWNRFHIWLEERGREIVEIPPDGLCFLCTLQHCLLVQYNEKYSLKEIQEKILHEIKSKTQYYMAFHTASTPTEIISQVQQYFDTHRFAWDIVDVIIGLCYNIFSVTLWIFQSNTAEKMDSISYTTDEHTAKRRHIHMVLYRERGDKEGFGNHYNVVVSQKKNQGQMYIDIQPDTTSGPPLPGDLSTPAPSPSYQNDHFNPTYVEDDGQQDFSSEPDASMYNLSTPDQCILFPLDVFADIEKEEVTSVPYNINGNHSYQIKIPNMKWHKVQEDGRWFVMHSSTMQHSNTVHKTGKCLGSFVCMNDQCLKYSSGKGQNTYAFTNVGFNLLTCGNVADREFCGALKLTMFYPDCKILEVFYAGTHTCSLKVRSAYNLMPEKMKKEVLKPILQKNPWATTKQISEEAAENFLYIGKPELARQSIRLAQDRKLVAEMKQEAITRVTDKDPNSFAVVAALQQELKSFDPYLIPTSSTS